MKNILITILIAIGSSFPALALAKDEPMNINAVIAVEDIPSSVTQLLIQGDNLCHDQLDVSLPSFPYLFPLIDCSSFVEFDLITADLNLILDAGNYLLVVNKLKGKSKKSGKNQKAEDSVGFSFTIGAIGLQGEEGETGLVGAVGPQGLPGDSGPAGLQGLPGNPGPAGTNGSQGIQGPAGTSGSQGIQGPVGPPGPPTPIAVLSSLNSQLGNVDALVALLEQKISDLEGALLFTQWEFQDNASNLELAPDRSNPFIDIFEAHPLVNDKTHMWVKLDRWSTADIYIEYCISSAALTLASGSTDPHASLYRLAPDDEWQALTSLINNGFSLLTDIAVVSFNPLPVGPQHISVGRLGVETIALIAPDTRLVIRLANSITAACGISAVGTADTGGDTADTGGDTADTGGDTADTGGGIDVTAGS